MAAALLCASLLSLPLSSSAYSWAFQSTPQQCQNISISIDGSGQPPYSVLIIPFGPTTLPNNIEARRIVQQTFPDNSGSVSFQIKYPANTQFVAVVSDKSGFGSGGTSVAATVLGSNDASCFDATHNVAPPFFFNLDPPNQIVQCSPTRLWWDPAVVQGTPQFVGIIPGGQSFSIPVGTLTNQTSEGEGFSWKPSVRTSTQLILVAGDDRGLGSGGSVPNTVSAGLNPDSSCLDGSSPSSTPGSPAGGSYPTSSSGASTGGNGGSKDHAGAIAGGVVGGIAFITLLVLAVWFFRRRRRGAGAQKERPVDLLDDDDDEGEHANGPSELPQYYRPEPFIVPDPTVADTSEDGDRLRPLSGVSSTSRSGTPDPAGTSVSGRKSAGGPRPLRPVNIIQHDDAGPSAPKNEEEVAETIELPPAYTNIRS